MGASFRANQMSVHAEKARDQCDGRTDRQTAFQLYIVDVIILFITTLTLLCAIKWLLINVIHGKIMKGLVNSHLTQPKCCPLYLECNTHDNKLLVVTCKWQGCWNIFVMNRSKILLDP